MSSEDMGRRFGFVTIGPFSGINERVLERLVIEFPELHVDRFDLPPWVRTQRRTLAVNLAHVLAERGPAVFLDRTRLWGAFYRTAFMFRTIQRAAHRRFGESNYSFTLQTQSLFDASVDGVPHYVYTDHTELVNRYYPDYERSRSAPDAWLTRERTVYARAEMIFTMSSHVSRSLIEHYDIDPQRVCCVLAGSNVTLGAGAASTEPEYAGKRILFVGRDWERKGGPDLLAAFALVREREPDASLLIVGCSPDVEAEGVEVLGELSPELLAQQYPRAAVFCMPSLVEPFGIVFVEALSRALPVVATTIGALPDLVQDGESGFLHAPHDVRAIAASLLSLLGDPELARRLGRHGQAFVSERYTWAHAVAAIAAQIRASASLQ